MLKQKDTSQIKMSGNLKDHPALINTCDKCISVEVCCLFRDFGKVLVENFGKSDNAKEDYPVNPFELATICSYYKPKRMIED